MGWDIKIINTSSNGYQNVSTYLPISNLTWNYSRPDCQKYWYGPDDMDDKTVKEVIKNMERAVSEMIADGIVMGDCFVRDDIPGFLNYLIRQYQGFIKMPRDWKVKLQ